MKGKAHRKASVSMKIGKREIEKEHNCKLETLLAELRTESGGIGIRFWTIVVLQP